MINNVTGVDISVWQDLNSTSQMYNPWKTREQGGSFVGIKASQGNFVDPDFVQNWANCKSILHRMPYHFLVWEVNPKIQAETFWNLLEKNHEYILPMMCDFEWWNTVPLNAMDVLYNYMERLKTLCGDLPLGIYSARSFWNSYGSADDYWKQYALWICDINGPVEVPKPWTNWDFHQYTFKLDGPLWGAESLDLDGDYYNGTVEDMMIKYNLSPLLNSGSSVIPPIIPPSNTKQYAQILSSGLNVRKSAGANNSIIETKVYSPQEYEILDSTTISNGEVWKKISYSTWICSGRNGVNYIQVIEK